jgi:flagellum-specific ATP synthase
LDELDNLNSDFSNYEALLKKQKADSLLSKYNNYLTNFSPIRSNGQISKVSGLLMEAIGTSLYVGEMVRISPEQGASFLAEVTGLQGEVSHLMPYEESDKLERGAKVVGLGKSLQVGVGKHLLGRVVDGLGRPIDDKGPLLPHRYVDVKGEVLNAMQRPPIREQIETGVRAIDSLLPIGKGQRVGIFAGSGVGKSTLLGMIARNSSADVNVIALIGERGREVREFLENELGEEGLKRSVVVVSTSDKPALARLRGASIANSIAEYFRDLGQDVMLMFDSVTRLAMSQREIGLANGEVPASRGYTPSVFSLLPKVLERSGTSERGSITGIYTVLVDGDDMEEPISDAVRGILDGHIILSRQLAEQYHFPAIDVLKSISRLAPKLHDAKLRERVGYLRRLLAAYRDTEDLIRVGAYVAGSDSLVDESVAKRDLIEKFLCQGMDEHSNLENTLSKLGQLVV